MIILGYQGVGKSTVIQKHTGSKFIDLESSNFWADGKRSEDWYKVYVNMALCLSKQGYIVFMSSHKVIMDEFVARNEKVFIAYPDKSLKDFWIDKLEKRYKESGLEKDYKAYMNALDRFDINMDEFEEYCTECGCIYQLKIDSPYYDFISMLDNISI